VIVGGFAAFMMIDEMVDLTNIGTMCAILLFCVCIIIKRYKDPDRKRPFRVPSNIWWALLPGAVAFFALYYLPRLLGPQFVLFGHQFSLPEFMLSGTWAYIEPPLFIIAVVALLLIYPRTRLAERLPLGAWSLPLLGATSCIFLMYYLPPTSWWRFIAWLMIGLAIYLSFSYTRSAIGATLGRPRVTPVWLALLGLGSFLIAVGLLVLPHDAGLNELVQQLNSGVKRAMIAFGAIGIGVALSVIAAIVGMMRKTVD
jgi:amino acid transporter